jgi:hypothetical protein
MSAASKDAYVFHVGQHGAGRTEEQRPAGTRPPAAGNGASQRRLAAAQAPGARCAPRAVNDELFDRRSSVLTAFVFGGPGTAAALRV